MREPRHLPPDALPTVRIEEMASFIEALGGEVRFDTYMREHLVGTRGYYRNAVEIGTPGHFETEVYHPGFAHLLYEYVRGQNLGGKDFLEIGGGDGTFKRQYLERDTEVNYISLDASRKLATMQALHGPSSITSAAALGLKDDSIDGVIFANELLDVLPCRVFRIGKEGEGLVIRKEGYVTLKESQSLFRFGEAQRDDFLVQYERFLNERTDSYFEEGDIVSVAPESEDVIRECMRVLGSGKIMLFDYGFSGFYPTACREHEEMPYFRDGLTLGGVDAILKRPYEVDITFMSDFPFLAHLAEVVNPDASVRHDPQHHFFRWILRSVETDDRTHRRFSKTSTFNVLRIDQ